MMALSLKSIVCLHFANNDLQNELLRSFSQWNLIDMDDEIMQQILNSKAFDIDVIECLIKKLDVFPNRWLSVVKDPDVFSIALDKLKPEYCYTFFPSMLKDIEKAKIFLKSIYITDDWKSTFILYCLDVNRKTVVPTYIEACDPSFNQNAILNFAVQKNDRETVSLLMADHRVRQGYMVDAINACIDIPDTPFDLILNDEILMDSSQSSVLLKACLARNQLVIAHVLYRVPLKQVKIAMLNSVAHGRLSSIVALCERSDLDVCLYVNLCVEMAYANEYLDIARYLKHRFSV